jgi:hypothetical protein
MPEVKVLSVLGAAAAVRYEDKTLIISKHYIKDTKSGGKVDVPLSAISTSTEYGIDWSIIIPEGITISAQDIQSALYARGIFTIEDIEKNPNGFANAVSSVVHKAAANLFRKVHEVVGGS